MSSVKLKEGNGKQVLILYVSTFLGTLLGILSSVINTRSLDTVSYGDFKYVQNIISFISSLLLFGFFLSGSRLLAISKTENDSRKIRGIMVLILGITMLVVMAILVIFYFIQLKFIDATVAPLFIVALPVSGAVLMKNYINTTAQGDNHINRIAYARLLPASIYVFVAYLIYSKYGATTERMLLLQSGISVIVFLVIILSTKPSFSHLRSSYTKLKEENKKYGIHLYYGSLAMVATTYLSGITLGIFNTNNTDVGYFTLALTIATPLAMLPSIIGTTYFKKFATQKKIDNHVMKNTLLITVSSLVAFILIIRPVVSLLYPNSYSSVSTYASFLAVGMSIHGFGDMMNRFLGAHGQGKQIRNSSFLSGFILVSGSVVLVFYFGISGAIITKVLSSLGYAVFISYYYVNYIKALKVNA